jgi:hypothetical protein
VTRERIAYDPGRTMKPGALLRLSLPLLAAFCGLRAAPDTPAPAPRLDITATGTLGYDDNLYGIDTGRLSRVGSGFSTAALRVATKPAPGLVFAYAPAATVFFDEARENHVKHLLSAAGKGAAGDAWSWDGSTDFTVIDGDRRGVDYGPGCGHAFSTALPRERRAQWQNRSDLALRHDTPLGFVRAAGRLQYWDMHTTTEGGANYVDRHDIAGGLDLGRALREGGPELYLGHRLGYQFQDRDVVPDSPRHASNHYARTFFGLDGRLSPAVKISGQAGWARHRYPDDPAVYRGPKNEEGLFTDITFTWTPTRTDEVQLKTSRCRTLSTTGFNSIELTSHQITWKHVFGQGWSATLGARFIEADYAPADRDDLLTTATASLTHTINASWSATLLLARDRGRDSHDNISGPAAALRDFDRHVISLALTWKR